MTRKPQPAPERYIDLGPTKPFTAAQCYGCGGVNDSTAQLCQACQALRDQWAHTRTMILRRGER